MQSDGTFLLMLMAGAIAVAMLIGIIGIVLTVRGIRGRREGTEPHCRSCDYLLVGIDSQRCPECGKPLNSRTIVLGQRVMQPWLAGVGGTMIMLGFLATALISNVAVQTINWYQSIPAFFVMRDFRVPATRFKALTELDRRDVISPVAKGYRDEIVQQALLAQAASTPPPETPMLLEFAARQQAAGRLSEAQQKQLFEQCLVNTLEVRKRVAAGDPVPYLVADSARTPRRWEVRIKNMQAALTQQERSSSLGGSSTYSGIGSGGSSSSTIPSPPPGDHELKVNFEVEVVRYTGMSPNEAAAPLFQQQRQLTAKFTVEPPGGAAPIVLVHETASDQPQRRAIEKAITTEGLNWLRYGTRRMEGTLVLDRLPIGIAFDVFASFNGGEYSLGSVTRAPTETSPTRTKLTARQAMNSPPPDKVNLILRPNLNLAKRTIDLIEIYGDEVVLKDVTVRVDLASDQRSTTRP